MPIERWKSGVTARGALRSVIFLAVLVVALIWMVHFLDQRSRAGRTPAAEPGVDPRVEQVFSRLFSLLEASERGDVPFDDPRVQEAWRFLVQATGTEPPAREPAAGLDTWRRWYDANREYLLYHPDRDAIVCPLLHRAVAVPRFLQTERSSLNVGLTIFEVYVLANLPVKDRNGTMATDRSPMITDNPRQTNEPFINLDRAGYGTRLRLRVG